MSKFYNADMAELAHQLTISPRRLRLDQFARAERLLGLLEADRAYPFEFVCHGLTTYQKRGTGSASASIPGNVLISDLVTLVDVLSRKSNLPISLLLEPFWTHEDLAAHLRVSTKTIRRWRTRGLMGLRMVFEDGVSRLVFCKGATDRFVSRHKTLVEKGASFRQLTSTERETIVERARELLTERPMNLHAVARAISKESDRAVETVRYTLRRHDEAHRSQALFSRSGESMQCERDASVWRCRQAGDSSKSIARTFGCSVEEVEEILCRVELQRYRDKGIEYVYNELFDAPTADALILDVPEPPPGPVKSPRIPKDLPSYLSALYLTPLLTREQESDLFRRYNYVKYKAARLIESLDVDGLNVEKLGTLRDLIAHSDSLKQRIIGANLRLVVGIAKKHVGWSPEFFEVISDGNISLMRAAEKFDYSRGNKFSTYATWAVVKNYARSIPEAYYRRSRFVTGQDQVLDGVADGQPEPVPSSDRQEVRQIIDAGMDRLTDRERVIVTHHFGLSGDGATVTLEQLGKRFGVTKERVRQIERRALGRLREVLAPSLVDTFCT